MDVVGFDKLEQSSGEFTEFMITLSSNHKLSKLPQEPKLAPVEE